MVRVIEAIETNVEVDKEFVKPVEHDITDPDNVFVYREVFHATSKKAIGKIMKEGISTMAKKYVHFGAGLPEPGEVISGMTSPSDVCIELNIVSASFGAATVEMKIPFKVSFKNQIIVSKGIGEA